MCDYVTQTPKFKVGLPQPWQKISWKIWEQFSHPLEPAHNWFNFLTNGHPVVCEQLAAAASSRFMPSAFLSPAQAAMATGRARDVREVPVFSLGSNIHIHHAAFDTHHVAAGMEDFLQQWRKRIWWTKEKLPLFHLLAVTALISFFSCLVPDEPPSSVLVTPHTTSSVLVQWQVGEMKKSAVPVNNFLAALTCWI